MSYLPDSYKVRSGPGVSAIRGERVLKAECGMRNAEGLECGRRNLECGGWRLRAGGWR
jgi:hypothetical protein